MKNTIVNIAVNSLACLFIMSLAFVMGSAFKDRQWKERVYNWDCNDLNDFYVDSSWRYQEGHKLDLPEELLEVESYDSDSVNLMAAFIDDVGDFHLVHTRKKWPSDSLLLTR